ncbi:MAG: TRIC cation channel family protein [Bacteroidota bacterium]
MTKSTYNSHPARGPQWLFRHLALAILVLVLLSTVRLQSQTISRELKSGWFPRAPYQMEEQRGDIVTVTGLDIQVAREVFQQANYRVDYRPMSWKDMMDGLRDGTIDFVAGSYYEKGREDFVHLSVPYRTERNAIYYHRNIDALDTISSEQAFREVLKEVPLQMAINEDYAYGSETLITFLEDPPPNLTLVPSSGYSENLDLVIQREADLYISNPIIMDRILAQTDYANEVKKSRVDMGDIPVHIMYSKKTVTPEEVDRFDRILLEMRDSGYIRSLHINYILPVYLSITTSQFWFILLNYLGIIAFCISGVMLARKERYNLFGALILATLPAIGGGVLRDLVLGAEQVFVLDNPGYMLFAIAIVLISFMAFRLYDYLQARSGNVTQKIDLYTDKKLGGMFGQIYKLLDAWAVAAFTIIGVSMAIEMQSTPLWLWGPAMGVMTASGGVLLRDIVRADFNIAILKHDSFAEISILGGILYTATLAYMPLNISLELIFYLTIIFIIVLFGFRFFILWKGYENPLQFGAIHTSPKRRLQAFTEYEPRLWELLARFYQEDENGNARPLSQAGVEHQHNQFLYTYAKLKDGLDEVASEPLSDQNMKTYRNCSTRLNIAASVEETLFSFLQLPLGLTITLSEQAAEFQQRLHESLKINLETASWTISSGDELDYQLFEGIVSQHQERYNQLRDKYSDMNREEEDTTLNAVLQTTHKAERIIYLLGEYVKVRTGKKEMRTGGSSNRKAQQAHLLS